MIDSEERITSVDDSAVTNTGAVVNERTTKFESKAGPKTAAVNLVWYVYGLIAFLLGIRLLLKLFGANSASGFVDFIYRVSGILNAPFDNVFGVTKTVAGETQSVFEPSI
jgi:hypothetical protein